MCTNPITIPNKTKLINPYLCRPFIKVACGKCEECQSKKQKQAAIRGYYEYKNSSNWSYFDTLTYNNNNLPKILGVSCFNRKHITNFLKRLRITLERNGYCVKGNLRYFLASEYGTKFDRPHYHIIFFSSVPGLSPHTLWRFTRLCWTYGFNDNIVDVQKHTLSSIDGIMYVAKYVSKDCHFNRAYYGLLEKYKSDNKLCEYIKENYHNIKPFRRSSLGFGISICNNDLEELLTHGVKYYNSKGVQFAQLPDYIDGKLHKTKIYDNHFDTFSYQLNSFGIEYRMNKLDENIDRLVLKYKSVIENENIGSYIRCLLGTRNLRDFVIYQQVYKGWLCRGEIQPYKDFYFNCINDFSGRWLDSPFTRKSSSTKYLAKYGRFLINEDSKPEFAHFDVIDYFISSRLKNLGNQFNETKLIKINQHNKLKEFYDRFYKNH